MIGGSFGEWIMRWYERWVGGVLIVYQVVVT